MSTTLKVLDIATKSIYKIYQCRFYTTKILSTNCTKLILIISKLKAHFIANLKNSIKEPFCFLFRLAKDVRKQIMNF